MICRLVDRIMYALREDHTQELYRHLESAERHHEELQSDLVRAKEHVDVLRELVVGMRDV